MFANRRAAARTCRPPEAEGASPRASRNEACEPRRELSATARTRERRSRESPQRPPRGGREAANERASDSKVASAAARARPPKPSAHHPSRGGAPTSSCRSAVGFRSAPATRRDPRRRRDGGPEFRRDGSRASAAAFSRARGASSTFFSRARRASGGVRLVDGLSATARRFPRSARGGAQARGARASAGGGALGGGALSGVQTDARARRTGIGSTAGRPRRRPRIARGGPRAGPGGERSRALRRDKNATRRKMAGAPPQRGARPLALLGVDARGRRNEPPRARALERLRRRHADAAAPISRAVARVGRAPGRGAEQQRARPARRTEVSAHAMAGRRRRDAAGPRSSRRSPPSAPAAASASRREERSPEAGGRAGRSRAARAGPGARARSNAPAPRSRAATADDDGELATLPRARSRRESPRARSCAGRPTSPRTPGRATGRRLFRPRAAEEGIDGGGGEAGGARARLEGRRRAERRSRLDPTQAAVWRRARSPAPAPEKRAKQTVEPWAGFGARDRKRRFRRRRGHDGTVRESSAAGVSRRVRRPRKRPRRRRY